MAIATLKPTVASPTALEVSPEVKVSDREIYKTATVDNSVTAPESLQVYLEGMPWAVDYYSQIISAHDDIREVDIGQNASLQQYQRIRNLELRVQADLSQSFEADTGRTTVTGNAIIIQVVPNKYDYFVTESGVKERTLFMVTAVEQKSYMSKTVYSVEYTMIGHIDTPDNIDRCEALAARTIRTFYFHKDRITEGASPLLTSDEHNTSLDLKYRLLGMYREYCSLFGSNSNHLVLVPDPLSTIYDTRLSKFFLAVVDSRDAVEVQKIDHVSPDREPYLSKPSLWTALLSRDFSLFRSTLNKAGVIPRAHFGVNSYLTSTNCWNIDLYVYPAFGDDNNAKAACGMRGHPAYDARNLISPFPLRDPADNVLVFPNNTITIGMDVIPVIKPAHQDGWYVLSGDFYHEGTNLSLLEMVAKDYIHNKPLNMDHVARLHQDWASWPPLEKCYYAPLIILFTKDVIRGFY